MSCSDDTFVFKLTSMLLMNINGNNPKHLQAANHQVVKKSALKNIAAPNDIITVTIYGFATSTTVL
ncbi:MAG: hypothetical protein IPP29_19865 [Bacteroidetes bacterium]|nr:hypothetical protein [Bacteroidota bacterium]